MAKTKKVNPADFKLGWLPDIPDARDFAFMPPLRLTATLPPKVNLKPLTPPVYHQGTLGSCTANALLAAYDTCRKIQRKAYFFGSRLFLYYNERVMMGTVNSDSGAYIRDGIKSLNKEGVCTEKMWPYDISKYRDKPGATCYDAAKANTILTYSKISDNDLTGMKACLAEGFPFVFGFTVYESFYNIGSNGVMPYPDFSKERVKGGHAVMAVGYDDAKGHLIIQNSWGTSWGEQGYFYMPYTYVTTGLCRDFWTIRLVKIRATKPAKKKPVTKKKKSVTKKKVASKKSSVVKKKTPTKRKSAN